MTARTFAKASAGAVCWLGIFAGVSLIALDHRQGWIGVTVIFAALLTGIPVLAWVRHGQQGDDPDGGGS